MLWPNRKPMTSSEQGSSAVQQPIRLGTRKSKLATTQSGWVADRLGAIAGRPVELVLITTEGDVTSGPLANMGGTGVFVSAVRDELLAGNIDLAVHSLKDLPTELQDGIALAAVPEREDAHDALCARDGLGLQDLPAGAVVGTGSPRRRAQLRAARPDLELVDLRGNIDTRLTKVTQDQLDAVVLAAAGLNRVEFSQAITELLDFDLMLPAPGQGALAIETRSTLLDESPALAQAIAELDDLPTRLAVTAERALLRELEAGCSAPVGALAQVADSPEGESSDLIELAAVVASEDGSHTIRESITGSAADAQQLGVELARKMLAKGASELMQETK